MNLVTLDVLCTLIGYFVFILKVLCILFLALKSVWDTYLPFFGLVAWQTAVWPHKQQLVAVYKEKAQWAILRCDVRPENQSIRIWFFGVQSFALCWWHINWSIETVKLIGEMGIKIIVMWVTLSFRVSLWISSFSDLSNSASYAQWNLWRKIRRIILYACLIHLQCAWSSYPLWREMF